jgi:hypothetical protein
MATHRDRALVLGLVEYVSASTASRRAPSPWQEPMQLSSPGGGTLFASWRQAELRCTWPSSGATRSISARPPDEGRRGHESDLRHLGDSSCRSPSLSSPSARRCTSPTPAGTTLLPAVDQPRLDLVARDADLERARNHFYRLSLDVSAARVHLAWVHTTGTRSRPRALYYRRSLDGGLHWQRTKVLVAEANQPGPPGRSPCAKGRPPRLDRRAGQESALLHLSRLPRGLLQALAGQRRHLSSRTADDLRPRGDGRAAGRALRSPTRCLARLGRTT